MTTDLLKPELSFLNNMDLAHKNAWAPFSNYTLQLHMDFHGFKRTLYSEKDMDSFNAEYF